MKKIISSFLFLSILFSCSKSEKKEIEDKPIQQAILSVVGIGKVLPKDGIIPLATAQTNQVVEIYKKLGDSVKAGEIIFKMKSINENLNVELAENDLKYTIQKNKTNTYELDIAYLKMKELKQVYLTSNRLLEQNAETKQKVFLDSIAYVQQLQVFNQIKQSNIVDNDLIKEKNIQLKSSVNKLEDQNFRALQSGVLISLDLTLGQVLTANTIFGELAQPSNLVIEGEIDELYASEIKLGQEVEVYSIGQNKLLAKGLISFVGVSLQNKSILYETIGEGSDRRVRRFTVTISKENENLLINEKVECKIKI